MNDLKREVPKSSVFPSVNVIPEIQSVSIQMRRYRPWWFSCTLGEKLRMRQKRVQMLKSQCGIKNAQCGTHVLDAVIGRKRHLKMKSFCTVGWCAQHALVQD